MWRISISENFKGLAWASEAIITHTNIISHINIISHFITEYI